MQKKKKLRVCRLCQKWKGLHLSSLLEKETASYPLTQRIVAFHGDRGEAGMMKIELMKKTVLVHQHDNVGLLKLFLNANIS
jgi:hypothetical protein